MALRFREKHLYLQSHRGALFLSNTRIVQTLCSDSAAEPVIEALLCVGMLRIQITSGSPLLQTGFQQTFTTSGLELVAFRFREKRLYLLEPWRCAISHKYGNSTDTTYRWLQWYIFALSDVQCSIYAALITLKKLSHFSCSPLED